MIRLEEASWVAVQEISCTTLIYNGTSYPDDRQSSHLADFCVPISLGSAAGDAWTKQRQPSKAMGDGIVIFKAGEIEFVPLEGLFELGSFWRTILRVLEEFLENGNAEKSLEDQPANVSLRLQGRVAKFSIDDVTYTVSPRPFIQGLLEGARDFYSWLDTYIGHYDPADRSSLAKMQTFL